MIEAIELRAHLRARFRPSPTRIPGSELECAVRLLSDAEVDAAKLDAVAYLLELCRKRGMDLERFLSVDPEAFDRERTRQIIVRAFVQRPKDEDDDLPESAFTGVDMVRSLDSVTVEALLHTYLDHQDSHDTSRELLDDEQAKDLATNIVTHGDAILSQMSHPAVCRVAKELARRLAQP